MTLKNEQCAVGREVGPDASLVPKNVNGDLNVLSADRQFTGQFPGSTRP